MSITVNWDDEAMTCIRYTIVGRWTWDDMYFAMDERDSMILEAGYAVNVIMDLRDSTQLPPNAIAQTESLMRKRDPKVRHVVLVGGANRFLRSMYNMFVKVTRVNSSFFHLVDNLDDAYAVLA